MKNDHTIFRRPYRLNVSKLIGVHGRCRELLATRLIEFSNRKYVCATIMPLKKDIFGAWTGKPMCGDYRPINWKTKLDRYPIPIPEKLFDAIGFSRVFSIRNLRSDYHQFSLLAGDRVKTTFWGVVYDENNQLYH